MKYTKLGNSGLEISRMGLGCMSYGIPSRGRHAWTLDEDEARPFIRRAIEAGVNYFDTSNSYSDGTSEEILGRALAEYGDRDQLVIATKVYGRVRPGPNGGGLSRKAIFAELHNSLRRLNVEYIDLYQVHRWDSTVRIEETLEALDDLVRAGKIRYIGASTMAAWQFCKALYTSELNSWARFVSMQDHYNLLCREGELEMYPLCADQAIALLPWSPLARGRLTREWDEGSARSDTDEPGRRLYADADKGIVERVGELATHRGLSRAQVALAWVLGKSLVAAPIIGATKPQHLEEAISAVDIQLSEEECRWLEGS